MNSNSLHCSDILKEMEDYMFYEDNLIKSLRSKIQPTPRQIEPKKIYNNIPQESIFIPNQEDALFWCFYIIKNGYTKYDFLNNKNSLMSMQMKIEMVDLIRKNKDIVKMYKLDTISNLESNLANDKCLNLNTFLSLCCVENINIVFIKKNTYYEIQMNDTDKSFIVYEIQNKTKYSKKYGYEIGTTEKVNKIKNTHFRLETINKPIKSISAYKVNELIEICQKLSLDIYNNVTGKQKTKKELYELIILYFN